MQLPGIHQITIDSHHIWKQAMFGNQFRKLVSGGRSCRSARKTKSPDALRRTARTTDKVAPNIEHCPLSRCSLSAHTPSYWALPYNGNAALNEKEASTDRRASQRQSSPMVHCTMPTRFGWRVRFVLRAMRGKEQQHQRAPSRCLPPFPLKSNPPCH